MRMQLAALTRAALRDSTVLTRTALLLVLTLVVAAPATAQPAQGAQPQRPEHGRAGPARTGARNHQGPPDLFRARNGNWYTIFLVTPAGIILGDPINAAFATWLKERARPSASRCRCDTSSTATATSITRKAGAVFADTATFVAHENMLRNMDGRYPQMPGDMLDRNDNGVIDPDEIDIPTNDPARRVRLGPSFFATWDHNKDGKVPPAELQADIRRPDIVYSDRMRLELGGKTVEVIHPGLNHSDDATVMYFPAERAVFATEFLADALVDHDHTRCQVRAAPSTATRWRSGCGRIAPSRRWTSTSSRPATATVHEGRRDRSAYSSRTCARGVSGNGGGQSLEELKKTITLDKYKDWAYFARLREAEYRRGVRESKAPPVTRGAHRRDRPTCRLASTGHAPDPSNQRLVVQRLVEADPFRSACNRHDTRPSVCSSFTDLRGGRPALCTGPDMPFKPVPRLRGFVYRGPYAYSLTICTHEPASRIRWPRRRGACDGATPALSGRLPFCNCRVPSMPDHLHSVLDGLASSSCRWTELYGFSSSDRCTNGG